MKRTSSPWYRTLRKVMMLMLAVLILISGLPASFSGQPAYARFSSSIGEITHEDQLPVAPGVKQSRLEMNTPKGPLKLFQMSVETSNPYITLESGLSNGKLAGMQQVTKQAAAVHKPGHLVIGGINGDFYNTSSGVPLNGMIHEGKLLQTGGQESRIFAVTKEKQAFIGKMDVKVTLHTKDNQEQTIQAVNQTRSTNGLVLYTHDYDQSTYTSSAGTEVVLSIIDGTLSPQGTMMAKVEQVRSGQGNTALEQGKLVLSGEGSSQAILDRMKPGDTLQITTSSSAPWNIIQEAVGGIHMLVENGHVASVDQKEIHPRTAVGIKQDGSVFFLVVDGRQPGYSEGISLGDLAVLMKEMGAVNALNLDGGGSSTFAARQPGDSQLSVVNRPSDGGERSVANSLLVVSSAPQQGLAKLAVNPHQTLMLKGSHTTFEAKGQDAFGNPVSLTGPVTWKALDEVGTFASEGLFRASDRAIEGNIQAQNGQAKGTAKVNVVDKLDKITLPQTHLSLTPGEQAVIRPQGWLKERQVITDPSLYEYKISGSLGTMAPDGTFTAGQEHASGTIEVIYGTAKAEMKVEIGKEPVILESFENGTDHWKASGARYNSVSISEETNPKYVRFGKKSLKLEYDFIGQKGTSGAYVQPLTPIELEGYPDKIGMWFYGAGDNHWIRGQLRDPAGAAISVNFTNPNPGVDWEGWKYIEADIPKGFKLPLKLEMAPRVMETSDHNKNKAAVWIDQIRAVYGESRDDLINPTITEFAPAEGQSTPAYQPVISAVVKDNPGGSGIDETSIQMFLDGKEVSPAYDSETGKVSYRPDSFLAGGYHHVTVRVKDKFENPAEASWSFTITAGSQYTLEAPKELLAGSTYEVKLAIQQVKNLEATSAKITFDPDILQVVDADPDIPGIQTYMNRKLSASNIAANQADNEKGEIVIQTKELANNQALTDTEIITSITLKVRPDAKLAPGEKATWLRMTDGSFHYIRGETVSAFVAPHEMSLKYALSLTAKGLSLYSPTTITVHEASGAPAAEAKVKWAAPEELKNLAEITASTAVIWNKAEPDSVPLKTMQRGDRLLSTGNTQNAYLEVFAPSGKKGWIQQITVQQKDVNPLLGITNKQGELQTDLLTLSQLTWKLQAIKDGGVSSVTEVTVVPALGDSKPEQLVLGMTEDPRTSQNLTWKTGPLYKGSVIQYIETKHAKPFPSKKTKTVLGKETLISDPGGEMLIHEVTLQNLKPGTSYTYRVGDGSEQGWSGLHTFRTDDRNPKSFNFLFTTDSQANTEEEYQLYGQLLKDALIRYPDSQFILHSGDIVEDGAKLEQWNAFKKVLSTYSADKKFVPMLGNHDVFGDGKYTFRTLFELPKNGPKEESEWVYSFDYGDAHFAVLNSESGEEGLKKQAEWLKKDLASTKKKWKIAAFHRAAYQSNPTREEETTKRIIAPILEEAEVDLVLSGHDHAYARTFPMKKGVKAGEQEKGTVYLIGGSSGPKFYPKRPYEYFEVLHEDNIQVYTNIRVTSKKIEVEARNIRGEIIDTFQLNKKKKHH